MPPGFNVFLPALAFVDDIGAILVIAVAYSGSHQWTVLAAADGSALYRHGVRTVWVYVVVGAGIWYAGEQSGVHPTIVGGAARAAHTFRRVGRPRGAVAYVFTRVSE